MCSHKEAHRNNFQNHFAGVDDQEDHINLFSILSETFNFFVNSQEEAIDNDNNKDKSIKPWVDSNKLDDLVSKWICNWEAAKRNCGVILLLKICTWVDLGTWIRGKRLTDGLHWLATKLSQWETSDVLYLSHLLLKPLAIKFFTLLWIRKICRFKSNMKLDQLIITINRIIKMVMIWRKTINIVSKIDRVR